MGVDQGALDVLEVGVVLQRAHVQASLLAELRAGPKGSRAGGGGGGGQGFNGGKGVKCEGSRHVDEREAAMGKPVLLRVWPLLTKRPSAAAGLSGAREAPRRLGLLLKACKSGSYRQAEGGA